MTHLFLMLGFQRCSWLMFFSFTYDFLLACEAGPLSPRFASVVQMVWDKLANYIYIYIYAITLEATSMGFRGKCPRHHGLCHRLWLFPAHLFCQHSWDICKSQNASRTRVVKVAAKVNCRESTGKASTSETSRCESSAKAERKQMPSRKKGRESRRKEIWEWRGTSIPFLKLLIWVGPATGGPKFHCITKREMINDKPHFWPIPRNMDQSAN